MRLLRAKPAMAPQAIPTRDVATEDRPADGGLEGFESDDAVAINRARLDHLASLGLPVAGKSVLDVGSGPGHLAQFFVEQGCPVMSTDARAENIEYLRRLYPGHSASVLDVERDAVEPLGRFDVVFCYGLLYHLENPAAAIRKLVAACDELFLLETMICDSRAAVLRLEDEYLSLNQALQGLAHRPSPAWVAMMFDRAGMHHVYLAANPPRHPDYQFEWRDDLATARDGHLLRSVFVASRQPLDNDGLIPLVASA
jgi:SAM-dependent methyltransferase